MKNNKGYLLLESVMSLAIIGTLLVVIYTSLIFCIKSKASIEDKIEIQQQALEISKHSKSTIEKSKGIISVTSFAYIFCQSVSLPFVQRRLVLHRFVKTEAQCGRHCASHLINIAPQYSRTLFLFICLKYCTGNA